MWAVQIIKAILISSIFIQVYGQNDNEKKLPEAPLRTQLLMNRCTENVPLAFNVPQSLQYYYNSPKKLEYLAQVLGAPLFEFSLSTNEPNCTSGMFGVTVSIANNGAVQVGTNEHVFLNFTADGSVNYLVEVDEPYEIKEILYNKDNFCIARITKEAISLNLCKSKCYLHDTEQGNNLCVPRCCAAGTISTGYGKNVDDACKRTDGADWTPLIYETVGSEVPPQSEIQPQLVVNDIYAQEEDIKYTERIYDASTIRVLSDGRLFQQDPVSLQWKEAFSDNMTHKYCVDGYWDKSNSNDSEEISSILLRRYVSKEDERLMAEKVKEAQLRKEASALRTKIHIFCIHIPCAIIYLLVLIVYLSIWEKHHAHGWTIVCFAMCQFLSYITLITMLSSFVFGDNVKAFKGRLNSICVLFGILRHFFAISTYSWSVVLTFDVWTTLSSIRPQSSRSKGKLLMSYAGFAVGVPFLVVLIATVIEFLPNGGNGVIVPGYRSTCVVPGGIQYMLYVGVAYILLFTTNIVLACLTFRSLWTAASNAKKLTTSKKKATFGNKAALIGKLMLVMGFSLVFEFILNFGGLTKFSQYYSILEVYRLLQAIGLFWTFVCGAKTQQHLQEKFPSFYKKLCVWRKPSEEDSGMSMETRMSAISRTE